MQIVQLGLFSSVFKYVYNKILDPMWDWLSDLLASGFKFLADIIPGAVDIVMNSILGDVINMLLEWYYSKWFLVQSAILLLLDCIEDCFNVVSGLSPVYIGKDGQGAAGGQGVPLLFAVFRQTTVQNAFFTMIVVGFSICFFMAILATARSFFELAGEKTKPVTHIIRMTARSLLYLLLAPMMAFALILLSQAILTTIDKALTAGDEGKTSMARIVFCIASLDAVDTDLHSDGKEYNISYDKGPSKASLTDKYRKQFYYVDPDAIVPNFTNPEKSRSVFTFRGFDYFIGIGCGIFFTIVMCMVLAVFIGRVFDVVVLLIIQPFFVGMMPFDDGEYYRRWFELFLGKLFQGFGSVIGMRVYLMILEQIFTGNIRFSNSTSVGARLQDYLMMLLFAMGGAVAVRHVGPLVTGILSQAAATGEQMTGAAGWAAGAKIAGVEAAGVKKLGSFEMKLAGNVTGMAAKQVGQDMSRLAGRANRGISNLVTQASRGVRSYFGAGNPSTGAFVGGAKGRAGGGAGVSDGVGVFSEKSRPEIGGGSFAGSIPSGGVKSKAQKDLASFKTSSAGGAFNYNPSGTGRANDDRNKGSGQGMNMQDIVGGGLGQEIEMQDLSGSSNFSGNNPQHTGSGSMGTGGSGKGMSMQDIVGGSGQEIEMQDLSGNSLFTSDDPLNTGFYDPNTGGDKDE